MVKSSTPRSATGAILIGGRSTRMGTPKHAIALPDGRAMIEHVADVLRQVCPRLVVLGPDSPLPGVPAIPDLRPGLGPLAGIEALLASGLDDTYLVVPCDMPRLTAEVLQALVDGCGATQVGSQVSRDRQGAVDQPLPHGRGSLRDDQMNQPLRHDRGSFHEPPAVLSDGSDANINRCTEVTMLRLSGCLLPLPVVLSDHALLTIRDMLDRGERAVHRLAASAHVSIIDAPDSWRDALTNINTPDELSRVIGTNTVPRGSTGRAILLATSNPHKIEEVRAILAPHGYEVTGLNDVGVSIPEPEEDGAAFEANARIKAVAYARATGRVCLADDSGLEVDALGGAPGVHSARYAGIGATRAERDRANNDKLLRELARRNLPPEQRTARFVCAMCLASPDGRILTETRGTFEGLIAETPRGSNGFGYDPLLYLPDRGCTSAELPPEEKNARSHRGQAARRMAAALDRLQHSYTPS